MISEPLVILYTNFEENNKDYRPNNYQQGSLTGLDQSPDLQTRNLNQNNLLTPLEKEYQHEEASVPEFKDDIEISVSKKQKHLQSLSQQNWSDKNDFHKNRFADLSNKKGNLV